MSSSPAKERILIVDDSGATLEVLQRNLTAAGYRVFTAPGVAEAVEILGGTALDLVITDLKMPKVGGLDLVRHVRENFKDTEAMMITGYPSIEGAVNAIKTGAEEFLAKPFTDEELLSAVQRALDKLKVRRSGRTTLAQVVPAHKGFIGDSRVMQNVFVAIGKASSTSATVLITGESGTGKELAARAIHYGSARSSAPFVPVNCGGIPEALLESELFGHVKGAFTGADESQAGFFHAADGGTIFLDEVSDMSLAMQVKLLRVLQDREVCMVGSNRLRKVDVRILAATNRDLQGLVRKGLFREDLFYRLNVITIFIPPLRERDDDILLLAHHFVTEFAAESDQSPRHFSDKALQSLRSYNWPGNVRELENVIQRLVVMTDGDAIDVPDLPTLMRFSALRKTGFTRTLAEVEAEYISNVLASVDGNKTRAAELLGINRKTLREKLRRIEKPSS
ncbi:MAG: sigma-54-dependent Fis family transcriptional regulator [Planctomycetes bacterium B3_Pla]|nr:MAG: sigma-54-dependent Fis family transcriptional regulator [Planctomycetes bacterium B3_Pla]